MILDKKLEFTPGTQRSSYLSVLIRMRSMSFRVHQFSQVFVEILSNLASIIKVLGCIITSMGPYLQSNSWAKSFAPNGNFANFVDADDHTRMLEKARHISKESKAIAEKEAKSRYFEKYS